MRGQKRARHRPSYKEECRGINLKVSRQQAAQNRQRVIEVAARLFREKGCNRISLPEIMRAAHLTHGGFYAQFKSKKDLEQQALQFACSKSKAWYQAKLGDDKGQSFKAIVNDYLAAWHRDGPGVGCSLTAIGPESYRQNPAVRRVLTDLARCNAELFASLAPKGGTSKREMGLAAMASLVGAVILARLVDDRKLSDEILNAMRRSLVRKHRVRLPGTRTP